MKAFSKQWFIDDNIDVDRMLLNINQFQNKP